MDRTKLCEGELAAGIDNEVSPGDKRRVNTWITRLILVTMQLIVAISIFQLFKGIIFAHAGAVSSNLYLVIIGCTLATVCACLLLLKYQKLIQQFCRDNVQLGERLGARTYALEKANEEMRREIAERGRVEKALMESESRFRTIIREAALGIALIDKHGRVIEGNPALLAMLGYAAGELHGMEFTRINHPENAASSWDNFQQLLTGGQDVCRLETRYIRK
ncbi:MAG: PAS domain S-box protein, partial [Deltaproteobacteria bacterium]|nr:PAS domain S-box protein [Deltaproteobacteria bacterium]